MEIAYDGVSPELDQSVFIAPGVMLIGKIRMGAGSSVWFNAVLRGDNDEITIGERSNIQDGCVLHVDAGYPVTVGDDCVIGHGTILHSCTVGNRVLVGMGATVLNKAVLFDDLVVAAGALVPEGARLESGFLYSGVPVRQVRPLKEEEFERLRRGAATYTEKAITYRLLLHG